MNYDEFLQRQKFDKEELVAFSYGTLVSDPPSEFSRLPTPPFLMIDRILELQKEGKKGRIVAEKEVIFDEWFFQCHFNGDPILPGCLSVDAIWQLVGFYIVCNGVAGFGRALGVGEVSFDGQIRPFNRVVRYEIDIRRFSSIPEQGAALAVANASISVDDELIYTVKDAKAGVFSGIGYTDYPNRSVHSVGGASKAS